LYPLSIFSKDIIFLLPAIVVIPSFFKWLFLYFKQCCTKSSICSPRRSSGWSACRGTEGLLVHTGPRKIGF
jgi:hypothetical protein